MPVAVRRLAGWALCLWMQGAHAGHWTAVLPDGQRIAVVQDTARAREGYLLQRRGADGRLDMRYGQQGSVVFALGPDNAGPAALAVDPQGRAWIAGAAQAADGRLQAVLLRFGPDGQPDRSFGDQGRSATAPAGREARATDVQPLEDGSAFVAGAITDGQGRERVGVWRVRADGSLDPAFGLGGLWADAASGDADSAGLQRSPDGTLALGLRRAQGALGTLEVWTWRPGAGPVLHSTEAATPQALDKARLQWRNGRWGWTGAAETAPPPVPSAPPASAPPHEAADGATATPFAPSPAAGPTRAAVPPPGEDLSPGWLWLMLPVPLAVGWWWRRRKRSWRG